MCIASKHADVDMAADSEASSVKPGSEASTATQAAETTPAPTASDPIKRSTEMDDVQPGTEISDGALQEDDQDQAVSSLSLPQGPRAESEVEQDDGPDWSEDTEQDTAVLMPQPEQLDGRSTKTGYVYDVRMRFHNNVHGDDDHPEDPRRIWRIFDALNTAQCTDRMIKVPSREATSEELGLVHTESHIDNITKTTVMSKDDLLEMANSYNSIYLNNSSAFCARLSCGSLIELCRAVALGQVLNGVAIIRPPGHHAEPDEAGGFCLYNNVAIAARYLQKNHGLKKIFILDWDVHHGNGTQTAFIDDPNVVYCSIHRFDHGNFYPGDAVAAAHTTVGDGPGRGRTINIPWNSSGMGDSEYIYAFNKVIMPILYEFAPDFILVSAGFDAAKGDHIGQMLVTPAAYGHMTHMLKSLAGGKIILALEGGYNLDSIAVSGLACAKALLNDPIEPLERISPNALCVQTIHEVIEVQSRYWKSLPQLYIEPVEEKAQDDRNIEMAEMVSIHRAAYLRETHGMIKLPKLEGDQEVESLDNVYTTGEFRAHTLGANSAMRLDRSILNDATTPYIDHILSSGDNELIDIVVPVQPTSEDDKVALKDKLSALLAEIWDNYVSTTGYLGRRIILLAAGFGCHGLVAFMNERQKEVARYVTCVVLVTTTGDEAASGTATQQASALPMVTKKLGPWYLENSFVFVSDDHPVWERTTQKMNSRMGNLIRSERSMERLSESLKHLRLRIFNEIDAKLSGLPPVPENTEPDFDDLDAKDQQQSSLPPALPMDVDPTAAASSMQTSLINDNVDANGASQAFIQPQVKGEHEQSRPPQPTSRPPPQQQPVSQLPPKTESHYPSASSSPMLRSGVQPNSSRSGQGSSPSSSRPGSPLMNGTSASRPVAQPPSLVDRPSVVGHQYRTQPYPTSNGRATPNGPVPSSLSAGMSGRGNVAPPQSHGPSHSRAQEAAMIAEGYESRQQGMGHTSQQLHFKQQQQQQQRYLDEQRQADLQRAHEHYSQQQQQPTRHQRNRSDAQAYPVQGVESRPLSSRGSASGSGEHFSNGPMNSSSGPSGPLYHPSPNGSPHPPHSSVRAPPPQQQFQHHSQQQHSSPHHPSQQQPPHSQQISAYPPPSTQGNGVNGRPGPPSSMAAPSSASSFEAAHHSSRGSYSSQGPPPPPGQSAPTNQPPMGGRHPGHWPQQQQQQQQQPPPQQQQQHQQMSARQKRAEQDSHDPHLGQYPSSHARQQQLHQQQLHQQQLHQQQQQLHQQQQQQQQQLQQQHHQQEMEHQAWERRRWEMDQQAMAKQNPPPGGHPAHPSQHQHPQHSQPRMDRAAAMEMQHMHGHPYDAYEPYDKYEHLDHAKERRPPMIKQQQQQSQQQQR
ncbi:Histone deacetylase hda1 [Mortierella alpina]|nr:Histone deacetylase hda1 [Mortierella alpina]